MDTEKLYLPEWKNPEKKPKCIDEEYLKNVIFERNFSIKKDKIKTPPRPQMKCSKPELIQILRGLTTKPLGFEIEKYPSRVRVGVSQSVPVLARPRKN